MFTWAGSHTARKFYPHPKAVQIKRNVTLLLMFTAQMYTSSLADLTLTVDQRNEGKGVFDLGPDY